MQQWGRFLGRGERGCSSGGGFWVEVSEGAAVGEVFGSSFQSTQVLMEHILLVTFK